MVTILFLRHGESLSNKAKQFCGQKDAPLTEVGFRQAQEAAKYIINNCKIDAVYSSDLVRAKSTVEPTAKALGLNIVESKLLREVDVGNWQGVYISEIEKVDTARYLRFKSGDTTVKLGGAESFDDLRVRALKIVDDIIKDNDGKTVLVATHGGIIRMLVEKYLNLSETEMRKKYPIKNASITEVCYNNGKPEIKRISYDEYLTESTYMDFTKIRNE